MSNQFDLIAIGGGSGGLAVAEQAAKLGKKVALVDPQPLGGTCVNAGCVPKKVMWYAAEAAANLRAAPCLGIPVNAQQTQWGALFKARNDYIEPINDYWKQHIDTLNITHIQGWAEFVDANTVAVAGQQYSADNIVISSGGRPIVPPLPGADLGITSDGFFELESQPQKVAIIGAGYIGVELAGVLRSLGSSVDVFGLENNVLEVFDPLISESVATSLKQDGIGLHLGFQVGSLVGSAGKVTVVSASGESVGPFDTVIWAVGRRPNTDKLGLEKIGIEPQRGGILAVDEWQKTSVDSVFAIGDVIGKSPLTPVAVAAGRRLAEHLYGTKQVVPVDYSKIASVVFAHPPVGTMGLTEAAAREQHDQITVYQTVFTPMKYAFNQHAKQTTFKLVCAGEDEKVVGVHMVGDGVDEMLQGFAVAINMGATKADLDNTIAIHPTSAEELVTLKPENRVAVEKTGEDRQQAA